MISAITNQGKVRFKSHMRMLQKKPQRVTK